MFKNKHVIMALIVAPILAVIAYFAVDSLVAEKPKAAQAGESYSLAALPNCRYPSGHCSLKNADFKLDLKLENTGVNVFSLTIESEHPLQGAKVALVQRANETGVPVAMTPNIDAKKWHAKLEGELAPESKLQLVVSASDALYYGETELTFIQYETTFGEDFRHK